MLFIADLLLGLDLGTSSVKVVLYHLDGSAAGEGSVEYGIDSPQTAWAEQAPEVWWKSTVAAVRKALRKVKTPFEIRGIGLSGQMHGLVCLDREGRVLRPAILWADQRSGEEATQVNEFLDRQCLFNGSMNKVYSGNLLSSLLWVTRHEPDTAQRIAHVLTPKDYIRYRLTGEISTEPSDACGTGAFDIVAGRWLDEVLLAFALDPRIMPPVNPSSTCSGWTSEELGREIGLKAPIPVAGGAGDQPAQAVGNGLVASGLASSNIGTAGQFLIVSDHPVYDPEMRCNCMNHALPDKWYLLGANMSAGFSVNWLWTRVLGRKSYEEANRLAASVPAGSRGLIFHPYLYGDRTPHQNWEASASFIGLSSMHGAAEMLRAVMEGVVFSMREGLEIARSLGLSPSRIVASGGGARSSLWRQIQADVYDTPVVTTAAKEQACMGGAILAGVAAGIFDSIVDGCARMVHSGETTEPIPANVRLYEDMYVNAYRDFYDRNSSLYSKLFRWREGALP